LASDNIRVHRCPPPARSASHSDAGGHGSFAKRSQKWHEKCFLYHPVKVTEKTMEQQPLFDQGVWITPMVLAIAGIAAALCTLLIR
jgi:hypothetical protein